jgi:hypothetical protein
MTPLDPGGSVRTLSVSQKTHSPRNSPMSQLSFSPLSYMRLTDDSRTLTKLWPHRFPLRDVNNKDSIDESTTFSDPLSHMGIIQAVRGSRCWCNTEVNSVFGSVIFPRFGPCRASHHSPFVLLGAAAAPDCSATTDRHLALPLCTVFAKLGLHLVYTAPLLQD